PAGVGQDVVRRGAAGRDQLVADPPRERQVGQAVAVQVAELLAAVAELDAAEAVRRRRPARPGRHLAPDRLAPAPPDAASAPAGPPRRRTGPARAAPRCRAAATGGRLRARPGYPGADGALA